MTEVLNITSGTVSICIFCENENRPESAGNISLSENFKCEKNYALYQSGKYFLYLNKSPEDRTELLLNGNPLALTKIFSGIYCAGINFLSGINRLELYINSSLYGYAELEAFAGMDSYKEDLHAMLSFIGKYADSQIRKFLDDCGALDGLSFYNVKNHKTPFYIYDHLNTLISSVKPRSVKVSDKSLKFLKPKSRRKFAAVFSKRNAAPKRTFKGYKIIDAYNTEKNKNLKQNILKTINLLNELKVFYPGLCDMLKNISLLSAPLSLIDDINAQNTSLFYFCGLDNADMLYKFWCFAKINDMLSNICQKVCLNIFTFDETKFFADITKPCETKFVNTKTNLAISVKYDPKPDLPCIFISVKTNDERASLLNIYAFDAVYKKAPDKTDIIKTYAYPNLLTGKTSKRRIISKCSLFYFDDKRSEFENAIALSPDYDSDFDKFLKEITGDSDDLKYQNVFCRLINNMMFERKNVLTGVVKTRAQFEINISKNFYYIPQKYVFKENLPVKYVAIYQSKSLFGAESGILYYGEVAKQTLTERRYIKEIFKDSPELYYRFDIKQWQKLETPIKPKDFADVCMFTNMFLLKNAQTLPELYINSEKEFILYSCIKDFFEKEDVCGFIYYLNYLKFEKETITLYGENGQIAKFKKSQYCSDLLALTRDIMKII